MDRWFVSTSCVCRRMQTEPWKQLLPEGEMLELGYFNSSVLA